MGLLTKEDIQKISLYTPFRLAFAPIDGYSIITRFYVNGIVGNVLIQAWDEDERKIFDSTDLAHPGNDDLPILRRLEDMTDTEFDFFANKCGKYGLSKAEMAELIIGLQTPEVFLYCLSAHFDLFGLIDQAKAHVTYK